MQLAPRAHRLSLPSQRPRRIAVWSLLMVLVSALTMVVAGAIGTFLQLVVFDLGDQDLLSEAGARGYVAASFLIALMLLPGIAGVVLGLRARQLGERRLGTAAIAVNALVATYLLATGLVGLLLG